MPAILFSFPFFIPYPVRLPEYLPQPEDVTALVHHAVHMVDDGIPIGSLMPARPEEHKLQAEAPVHVFGELRYYNTPRFLDHEFS